MKKLAKFAAFFTSLGSGLYYSVLPAMAAATTTTTNEPVDLCKNSQGVNVSGLCGVTPGDLVTKVINLILFVAFVAALVFLIVGGIRWIISGGDKEGTAKAKSSVTSALIGLAIVLGAWILINLIATFFGAKGGLNGLVFPQLVPTI